MLSSKSCNTGGNKSGKVVCQHFGNTPEAAALYGKETWRSSLKIVGEIGLTHNFFYGIKCIDSALSSIIRRCVDG